MENELIPLVIECDFPMVKCTAAVSEEAFGNANIGGMQVRSNTLSSWRQFQNRSKKQNKKKLFRYFVHRITGYI